MMLMFKLGRPDVLPVDDLGVRKGAQLLDRLDELPRPRELAARGEAWGPYRSLAAFYLWRVADFADTAKPAAKPVRRSQG
jgi:DNA-3-methyladenine glycosylase II